MAFLRSLFSGVSALRNQQTMMDVIGNNIANVNTVGFKSGRATFSELYAQTLQGATRPSDTTGGTNPMQVGLGMSISTIDTTFSQGNIETTNGDWDLALYGSGFFVVNDNGQQLYTRAGKFSLDANGRLVSASGGIVQGKMADAQGTIPLGTSLDDIIIDKSIKSPAHATTKVKYSGNLDSSADTGATTSTSATIYDSLGNPTLLTLNFTKTAGGAWDWAASIPDPADSTGTAQLSVGTGTVTFNTDGTLQTLTGENLTITPTTGADPINFTLDFGVQTAAAPGNFSGITQSSGKSSVTMRSQDGYTFGTLDSIAVGKDGVVTGSFSNGQSLDLAEIMVAQFNNPAGLVRAGENCYTVSGNSGTAAIVEADGATTSIYQGSLEQSNVDLADEFTKMITAQRGFQASARIITTSDEFLQEVVNLKR
jgi:flagellar hook protein FlgE